MGLKFQVTRVSYSVEIHIDAFRDLLDSESHVTGNAAFGTGNLSLSDKLDRLSGVFGCDYNGHYGAQVVFTIDVEYDGEEKHKEIAAVISHHLKWCASLPKRH